VDLIITVLKMIMWSTNVLFGGYCIFFFVFFVCGSFGLHWLIIIIIIQYIYIAFFSALKVLEEGNLLNHHQLVALYVFDLPKYTTHKSHRSYIGLAVCFSKKNQLI